MTEVDEEKARLMVSNKRAAADDRVSSFKVGAGFCEPDQQQTGRIMHAQSGWKGASDVAGCAFKAWLLIPNLRFSSPPSICFPAF